jgi:hypothetical protein
MIAITEAIASMRQNVEYSSSTAPIQVNRSPMEINHPISKKIKMILLKNEKIGKR